MSRTGSPSILDTIDFNQFTLENIYLFKSYLFVKIIKKKLPENNLEKIFILNSIDDKLLLKIIDLCLINNNSLQKDSFKFESIEEICEEIYNLLLDEFKNLDSDDLNSEILVSKDFESNMLGLLSRIETFTKLIENKIESKDSESLGVLPLLRVWLIKKFYKFGIKSKKQLSPAIASCTQVSDHKRQNLISLQVFSLSDKMKIEDLMLKILDFTVIRARLNFDSSKNIDFYKVPRVQNKEYLDDLNKLIKLNKQLYNDLSDNYNFKEQDDTAFHCYTDESESDISVFGNSLITKNPSKTSSLIQNKTLKTKRKRENSPIDQYENESTRNFQTKSSNGYPKSLKTKRTRYEYEDDHFDDSSVSSQNETLQSVNEKFCMDNDESSDEIDDDHDENQPSCSRQFMVHSNAAFDHSNKANKFLSNVKSINIEKYISIPFDDLLKFHPLTLSVEKLPGIGLTYAQRLKNRKLNTFGNLVDLYQIKCKCSDERFYDQLKELTAMRGDSINKIINLIRNYSIQVKSAL